jgi:hypothetical protein
MTEAEWETSEDAALMLVFLRGLGSEASWTPATGGLIESPHTSAVGDDFGALSIAGPFPGKYHDE